MLKILSTYEPINYFLSVSRYNKDSIESFQTDYFSAGKMRIFSGGRCRPTFCPGLKSASEVRKGLRIDVGAGNVLVIEYWDLKFICNLVLVIWDFIVFKTLMMQLN
jgi:hypothetical protein